jgi:hypothetical protein
VIIGGLGSQSIIKIGANQEAARVLQPEFGEIISRNAPAPSNVSEQPTGPNILDDTPQGAINRLIHTQTLEPGLDLYQSIENGQMLKLETAVTRFGFYDEPILKIVDRYGQKTEMHYITEEMAVDEIPGTYFPLKYVWEAWMRNTGGDKEDTTTAEVMQEYGLVKNHKDPSIDLAGVPRQKILTNLAIQGNRAALTKFVAMKEFEKNLATFDSFEHLSIDDVEALGPENLRNMAEWEPREKMLIAMQEFEKKSEALKSLLD